MARKDALIENERQVIPTLAWYHDSTFGQLGFFNSDRFVKVTSDYKVSEYNTKSTLSILKVGSEIGGYGIELESTCSCIQTEQNPNGRAVLANIFTMIFDKLFPSDLFRMEQDCTVDAECVSQVMSKSFIRNQYKNFKSMWNEYFPSFGISTGNSNCGMHVNVSLSLLGKDRAEQIANARKLGYLINKNYDFFKVAFNRIYGVTTWCPRMRATKEYWQNTELYDFPIAHDKCCINMSHVNQGRLEIRLVGGQKDFACFRNTMETVFHIIDNIKKLSYDDCDDLSKVFKGCNSYVFDRISTNCYRANVIDIDTINKIRPSVKVVRFI